MFKGVCTALITPFDNKQKVDYKSFEKLLNQQIANSVDALLVCGTTGEPATMTLEERKEVVKFAIKTVNKRVPVYVGTGSNNTQAAIELSKYAEAQGADALLVVTPYYNKCTQNGVVAHYKAISDNVNIPIIVYNVPGRTGVNIKPETYKKLAKIKNVKAIKEASGNIAQIMEIVKVIKGTDLILYSGDDGLTLPILSLGAQGVISVASNCIPQEMHDIVMAYLNGDVEKAREMHFKYLDFMNGIFIEVNPIPIKKAAALMKICTDEVRLPLTKMEKNNINVLTDIMKKIKLI